MLDRTLVPASQAIDNIDFSWPELHLLQNGLPLYLLNMGAYPIVELELVCQSGSYYEGKAGVGYFTLLMLLEGTRTKTAQDVVHMMDKYGATITVRQEVDFCSITLSTLAKHLNPMLELFIELLLYASFPLKSFERLKQLKKQSIQISNRKHKHVAHRLFTQAVFTANHPYGNHITLDDLSVIYLEDLHDHYTNRLLAGCQAFVSGQISPAALRSIQQWLEQLSLLKPASLVHHLPTYLPSQVNHTLDQGQDAQSAIVIGKRLLNKKEQDFSPMLVVGTLLGGYFGSRLMRNIREEKGYTYGIFANVVSLQQTGYLVISTEVMQNKAQPTIREIYREIEKLHTDLVSMQELTKVRSYLLGHFLSTINDPFSIMHRFQSAHLFGLDQNYYTEFYHQVTHLDPYHIQQLARKYLCIDQLTEIIVC